SGSTRLELNDVLCVVGRGRDLPALSRLFSTTSTRQHLNNRQFFGDFILDGGARVKDVAQVYNFELPEDMAEMSLAELFVRQSDGFPDLGDSIVWHGLTWVVAEMEDGWIQKIGLKLTRQTENYLSLQRPCTAGASDMMNISQAATT